MRTFHLLLLSLSALSSASPLAPSKTDRVAIVGAGPAGVHLASKLTQLGYTNITLFERTSRVGGKSFTLYRDAESGEACEQSVDNATGIVDTTDCIAHEMGTCFLHNAYHTVRDLLSEYELTPEIAPEGRAMFSRFAKTDLSSQDMGDFIEASILAEIEAGRVKLPWWVPRWSPTFQVVAALVDAVGRYNDLHASIVGDVAFSMPPRMSAAKLAQINMTFGSWLSSNELDALVGFLRFAHAAQGYGYVDRIPALYGLWWVTPELLEGYVQMSLHQKIEEITNLSTDNPILTAFVKQVTSVLVGGGAEEVYRTTTMLPEGFGKLWQKMYEKNKLDVRFGATITKIDRQLDNPNASIIVDYSIAADGTTERAEFEFLVYTAAHATSHKYVSDLTAKEQDIFGRLTSYVLTTTLYSSDPVMGYSAPIMYNVGKMVNGTDDGEWYADRNDPLIFGGPFAPGKDRQLRVGYQFFQSPCQADPVLCDSDRSPTPLGFVPNASAALAQLGREFEARGVHNAVVEAQFPWPYFHHFPQDSINAGYPWDLLEMQGTAKTWWLGASACFESVHDVLNYNLQVLAQTGLIDANEHEGDGLRSRRLREERKTMYEGVRTVRHRTSSARFKSQDQI